MEINGEIIQFTIEGLKNPLVQATAVYNVVKYTKETVKNLLHVRDEYIRVYALIIALTIQYSTLYFANALNPESAFLGLFNSTVIAGASVAYYHTKIKGGE